VETLRDDRESLVIDDSKILMHVRIAIDKSANSFCCFSQISLSFRARLSILFGAGY